jgi:hypothetical protein
MQKEMEEKQKEDLMIYMNELIDKNPINPDTDKPIWNETQRKQIPKDLNHYFFEENSQKKEDIPEFLQCNISLDLIKEPVILGSGITYESVYINAHLDKNGLTDPVTRESLKKGGAIKNRSIKYAFEEFI